MALSNCGTGMKKLLLVWMALACACCSFGQQPDTLIKKLDSLNLKADSVGQVNATHPEAYNENTRITVPAFFILEGSNLKQAFTKPFHMSRQNWKTVGKFAVVLGAVALVDRSIQQWALNLWNSNAGLHTVSRYVTNFGGPYEGYTLGALGAYGFLFRNIKMQTTTLL